MRWFGRLLLLWTPGFLRARVCREVSGDFTALLAAGLDEGEGRGLAAFREAARETGRRAARRLKAGLGLSGGFEDAELAWRLVSKISGMKFSVKRQQGRSLFDHTVCPLFDAGQSRLCENFCLPMVEGLTEVLCPSCGVEIERPAGEGRPCAKALVRKE